MSLVSGLPDTGSSSELGVKEIETLLRTSDRYTDGETPLYGSICRLPRGKNTPARVPTQPPFNNVIPFPGPQLRSNKQGSPAVDKNHRSYRMMLLLDAFRGKCS